MTSRIDWVADMRCQLGRHHVTERERLPETERRLWLCDKDRLEVDIEMPSAVSVFEGPSVDVESLIVTIDAVAETVDVNVRRLMVIGGGDRVGAFVTDNEAVNDRRRASNPQRNAQPVATYALRAASSAFKCEPTTGMRVPDTTNGAVKTSPPPLRRRGGRG